MGETPGEVFDALLREWRAMESQIIREWGTDFGSEEAGANVEMRRWRERFDRAEALFVRALTG